MGFSTLYLSIDLFLVDMFASPGTAKPSAPRILLQVVFLPRKFKEVL